jgi:hypothetical protein
MRVKNLLRSVVANRKELLKMNMKTGKPWKRGCMTPPYGEYDKDVHWDFRNRQRKRRKLLSISAD